MKAHDNAQQAQMQECYVFIRTPTVVALPLCFARNLASGYNRISGSARNAPQPYLCASLAFHEGAKEPRIRLPRELMASAAKKHGR